jgi:transposase
MKLISPAKSNDILSLLNRQLSTREIANIVGVSQSTVCNIRKARLPNRTPKKSGRPPKLSEIQKRFIVRNVTSGKVNTATEMKKQLYDNIGVSICSDTIRNCLKNAGLRSFTKIKKPKLEKRHIKQRKKFARKYKSWTVEDLKRVIWSDETKINRIGSGGRKRAWKIPK